jgi:hypothetical protein
MPNVSAISTNLRRLALAPLLVLAVTGTAIADSHSNKPEMGVAMARDSEEGVRAAAVRVSAVIAAIDLENRELTLETPLGDFVTVTADAAIQRLDEFQVGDAIVATYMTSLAGEVREPTEEELEEPWLELDGEMIAGMDMPPGIAGARVIRAVCTIEGMNRVTGTAMIRDPRGKFHVIGDIPPEKFEGRMLGETIVMVYSEAIALTLERAEME